MEKYIKKGWSFLVWSLKGLFGYIERLFTKNVPLQVRWIKNQYVPEARNAVASVQNDFAQGLILAGAIILGVIAAFLLICLWAPFRSLVP